MKQIRENAFKKSVRHHTSVSALSLRNPYDYRNLNLRPTRQVCRCKCNIEAHSCNHCCNGKAVKITYSDCLSVAFSIQHVKRMLLVILSAVACLAVLYLSTLSHKRCDFRKYIYKYWTLSVCFDFLDKICLKHFSF